MTTLSRLRAWLWRLLGCQHPIESRDYRFRWEGEFADFYEVCLQCDKEFLP